jgi:hypothetical protein
MKNSGRRDIIWIAFLDLFGHLPKLERARVPKQTYNGVPYLASVAYVTVSCRSRRMIIDGCHHGTRV